MVKSLFEQMGGTYQEESDYLIPNITLPAEEEKSMGIYGKRHLRYLKEYRKVAYTDSDTEKRTKRTKRICRKHRIA